jgi:hypothetical protein
VRSREPRPHARQRDLGYLGRDRRAGSMTDVLAIVASKGARAAYPSRRWQRHLPCARLKVTGVLRCSMLIHRAAFCCGGSSGASLSHPTHRRSLKSTRSRATLHRHVPKSGTGSSSTLPPANLDLIVPIVRSADFVLVPCRVSALDLDALQPVIDACKRLSRPFAFILTQVSPQWDGREDGA